MKYLIPLLFLALNLSAKELAITFDDSPRFARGLFDGKTRAVKLVDALKQVNSGPVVFFSVSQRLDDEGIARLNYYANAGHIIANHTHSHPNFNELSLSEYLENFRMADAKLSRFKNFKKYFRFPYLREGDSLTKRDGMRKEIAKRGCQNGYVTLNNYDWYMETLFQRAIKRGVTIDMEKMEHFYVDTLMESIEYYDQMAIKHLKRSPKHILLLHEMDISALFVDDLIKALRAKGWNIVSLEEALTDPIAQFQITEPLSFNPGRIGEIAKSKGVKKGLWHSSLDEKYLEEKFNTQVLGNHR